MVTSRPDPAGDWPCEAPLPACRSTWSGKLQIGELSVPVKAYPATVSALGSPLHLLHAGCGEPIRQPRSCPKHGPVENNAVVKAYSCGNGQYLELDEADLAQLQAEDEKTIRLERFFPRSELPLELLAGRSLHLAPADPASQRDCAAVLAALENKGVCGLGEVVFAGRRQLVLVRPCSCALMLHALHWPAQRRVFPATNGGPVGVTVREVKALEQVISSASGGRIDWDAYRDDAEQKLAHLVESKRRRLVDPEKPTARSSGPKKGARKSRRQAVSAA